jgi:hypothetical protein
MRRDHYVGYKPGSWVIHGIYESVDGGPEKRVGGEKKEITKLRDGVPYFNRQQQHNDQWDGDSADSQLVQPDDPAELEVLERRRDTLQVDGQPVDCEVVGYHFERPREQAKGELSIWRTSELLVPYREFHAPGLYVGLYPNVIKAEYTAQLSQGKVEGSRQVVSADRKFKVGERDVTCVVESCALTMQAENQESVTAQLEYWLSDDVIGHEVQVITSASLMGQARRQVKRLEDFHTEKQTTQAQPSSTQRHTTFHGAVTLDDITTFRLQTITWSEESSPSPVVIIFDNADIPAELLGGFFFLQEITTVSMHFKGTSQGCAPFLAAMASPGRVTADPAAQFVLPAIPDTNLPWPTDPARQFNARQECARLLSGKIRNQDNAYIRAVKEGQPSSFGTEEAVSMGLVDRVTDTIPK